MLSVIAGLAQSNLTDSLKVSRAEVVHIKRLRAGLQQNNRLLDKEVAESLLSVAHQLNDPASQVVALCQLASSQWQEEQTQTASTTLNEAVAKVALLRDQREASWAMGMVGELMKQKNGTNLLPVLQTLGQSLGRTAVTTRIRGNPSGGRIEKQSEEVFSVPVPSMPSLQTNHTRERLSVEKLTRSLPLSLHFSERWLDSLVQSRLQPTPVVKELTEKKKLRDSSRELSRSFAQKGDYANAYNYYVQYTAYKDSLAAEVTARHLAAIQFKQASQKKEAQIKLLTTERQLRDQEARQQRLVMFAFIGLAGLLLAFSVNLVRTNRQRHRTNQQLNNQKVALENTLTELKTTQNQLIQSEKMAALGEMTAGIAHEIQNPLNFVNNFSEVSVELVDELVEIQKEDPSDEELQTELLTDLKLNLQKITQHGGRASAIVKGMLEHSRTVTGEKEPTDLNSLVEEQLRLAYHSFQAKERSFEAILTTQFDANLSPVNVVRPEIGRVLLNLYSNAFYAIHQKLLTASADYKPEIRVRSNQDGRQVTITVWDNGMGIPAAAHDKIFQPFFTTKPTGAGTGLGLSLSYDIITKGYGGTLTVATEVGQFTEFTITLPLTAT
ncbi:hypothetical protein GCM10027592_51510 [Spirosoma flavus]